MTRTRSTRAPLTTSSPSSTSSTPVDPDQRVYEGKGEVTLPIDASGRVVIRIAASGAGYNSGALLDAAGQQIALLFVDGRAIDGEEWLLPAGVAQVKLSGEVSVSDWKVELLTLDQVERNDGAITGRGSRVWLYSGAARSLTVTNDGTGTNAIQVVARDSLGVDHELVHELPLGSEHVTIEGETPVLIAVRAILRSAGWTVTPD